jgi:hypothetical protein
LRNQTPTCKRSDDVVVGEAHARATERVNRLSSEHDEQGADAMTTLTDELETLTLCRAHLPVDADPIHRERLDAIATLLHERERELAEKEAALLVAQEQLDRLGDDYTALLRALAQAGLDIERAEDGRVRFRWLGGQLGGEGYTTVPEAAGAAVRELRARR